MCGLSGIAGRGLDLKQLNLFKDLLYVSSLRGPHSTGVASVTNDKIVLNKMTGDAALFLDYFGGPKGYLMRERQLALIGHARWATIGNVTKANAHPYDTGRFIAAHNGTLRDREFTPGKHETRTDSELMFRAMNTKGIIPVLSNLSWWSAYAVSIWEKDTKKLHLARNTERPLFYGIQKDSPTVIWGSELRHLLFAAMGVGLEFDYFKCKAGHVYTFDVGTMTNDDMFTMEKLPEKTIPSVYSSSFMEWDWDETAGDFRPRTIGPASNTNTTSSSSNTTYQTEGQDPLPF
jgi:asparagine synthetase B (glutamine-hydrolysing)